MQSQIHHAILQILFKNNNITALSQMYGISVLAKGMSGMTFYLWDILYNFLRIFRNSET